MRPLIVSILVVATACSSLPRDPEGTLERVRHGVFRVGLVENPPWVVRTAGEPQGAEPELVRRLAASIGARPQWFWGSEERHMEALERFELDLVIGGLDDRNPWKKKAGFTRPYFEERVLVGVRQAAPFPASLKGLTVAAKAGDEVAGLLRKKDANPDPVQRLDSSADAVAGPEWQVEHLGFVPTRFELLKRNHVMVAPPGENAWLKTVGDFLYEQRGEIRGLLEREER
jgi:polar amino acid transport system substrate-binding protein